MWPIPDAGLGAVSYLLEILMAVMGTRDRWRTMPWMVTFFGILVIPLGVISIYFIIIQPIVIGTWSTPTLIAALAMLIMIPFALDEVIAMGQFLYWAHCRGKPLIRTFFKGDAIEGGEVDNSDAMASPAAFWRDTARGVTLPWTLAASIAIGVFLMLTRLVFGTEGDMANSDHVVGALAHRRAVVPGGPWSNSGYRQRGPRHRARRAQPAAGTPQPRALRGLGQVHHLGGVVR
jgi:hypothetical protein